MNAIDNEIKMNSLPEDIPILLWLNGKYTLHYEWMTVAKIGYRFPSESNPYTVKVWSPSEEGRILYENRDKISKHSNRRFT